MAVTACHEDDLGDGGGSFDNDANVRVLVPVAPATRANGDNNDNMVTQNATSDECKINTLRLIAFPQDSNGQLYNLSLTPPQIDMTQEKAVAVYDKTFKNGKYRVYVVANVADSELAGVDTEDALKNVMLKYKNGETANLPQAGSIPMIYEPQETIDNTKDGVSITADMQFTCAKVNYNIIFDKDTYAEAKAAFGDYGLKINTIDAKQLSMQTNLVWGNSFAARDMSDLTFNKPEATTGSYFNSYTYDDTKTGSNEDMVTESGTGAAKLTSYLGKWLYSGTVYLPERYVKAGDGQSLLKINAKTMKGSAEGATNRYTIPLGHVRTGETDTVLPRHTYYEIVGLVKTPGDVTLDTKVKFADWVGVTVPADFLHTTLTVSKTSAGVTSLANDSIGYTTNADDAQVKVECNTIVEGKPVIVCTKDATTHQIKFTINPQIKITDYGNSTSGVATVSLRANNLIKMLTVHYDVSPFFNVTPQEEVIYYDASSTAENTKNIIWSTNLDGIDFGANSGWNASTGGTSTVGSSSIKIECASNSTATGTFTITATSDPVTTVTHTFVVRPKETSYQTATYAKTIKVIVRPPIKDYIINFRAINDRQEYAWGASNTVGNLHKTLDEDSSTGSSSSSSYNWNDGWQDYNGTANQIDDNAITANGDNHHVYIYSQLGETHRSDSGTSYSDNSWAFTGAWPGLSMSPDYNNTGWYRYVLGYYATGTYNSKNKDGYKYNICPDPAKTLIIFVNQKNENKGYTLHRCTHHEDAGILLFDYEDREGWVVYDPTMDPYYLVFDDKPEIEDVTYKVYTKSPLSHWSHTYGVAQTIYDSTTSIDERFTMKSEASDGNNTCVAGSTQKDAYYLNTIKLKAIKGHHAKAITLYLNDTKSVALFGGQSFKNDTGYFDGSSWHEGAPY